MRRILLFILLAIPALLNAQDISVRSWFDTTRIYIGDHVNFNIEIISPEDKDLVLPIFKDTLSALEILNIEGPDTSTDKSGMRTIGIRYLVTSFDTGLFEIDPVFVEETNLSGIRREYSDYSQLEVLRVNIMPADSTQLFFDIIGPRKAKVAFMEVFPWALLVVLVIILVYFLVRYIKSHRLESPEEVTYLPSEPVHIIALRDLDKLEREQLWQKSKHKAYYSRLTNILKLYIDRRYNISCLELTSSETLSELSATGFNNKDIYKLLEGIFGTADLSKFAKFKPEAEINIRHITEARTFVRETSRIVESEVQIEDEPQINTEEAENE